MTDDFLLIAVRGVSPQCFIGGVTFEQSGHLGVTRSARRAPHVSTASHIAGKLPVAMLLQKDLNILTQIQCLIFKHFVSILQLAQLFVKILSGGL